MASSYQQLSSSQHSIGSRSEGETLLQQRLPSFLNHPRDVLPPILLLVTCVKIMLMPSYRSTDFDVHRNWLAITHQLPIGEWYFDDVNGTTVHTLDYPPSFAFFEWALSNNPVTKSLFSPESQDRCLDLLPDDDNTPSLQCILFQRTTVVLSDVVFWIGAWVACWAFHFPDAASTIVAGRRSNSSSHHSQRHARCTLSFLLIVLNPGLLWLDHIHFQYNGMLLGILLGSLGLLMWGKHISKTKWMFDYCHLGGAVLYAMLVNLKHLYLPLAPIYFWYLLRVYCFHGSRFRFKRFSTLAILTLFTLVVPWIPFTILQDDPKKHALQILSRLFPFGRGLVHDYWAANVWAFWSLGNKLLKLVSSKVPGVPLLAIPEPTPAVCALLLFVSMMPALWTLSYSRTNSKLMQSIVYTSFCTFMLGYHVHEKAILTAIIPLTVMVEQTPKTRLQQRAKVSCEWVLMHNFLFWQTSLWGLLGLIPLLFRPMEWAFVLASYYAYMEGASSLMQTRASAMTDVQRSSAWMAGFAIFVLWVLPIQGQWEFLPLLVTSIVCAQGLLGCWALSLWLLLAKEPSTEPRRKR